MPDILKARVSFPETVYVIGTGPDEPGIYERIPSDAFVIVVNGAIEIPLPVEPAMWVIQDPKVPTHRYCKEGMAYIRNSGHDIFPDAIKAGGPTIPVISEKLRESFPWIKAYYREGAWNKYGFSRECGLIVTGATVAGSALQIALLMGARFVRTIGVNMYGHEYFDGSKHEESSRKGEVWKFHKEKWDYLIHVFESLGYSIQALKDIPPDNIVLTRHKMERVLNVTEPIPEMPGRVVIVGTGPNGVHGYGRIKPDDFVIACNGAIGIPEIKPDLWLCADGNTVACDYFKPGIERCKREGIKTVWSGAVEGFAGEPPDYRFYLVPEHRPGFRHVPELFRPDETIAGIALDMAYRAEVKDVAFCGIDMGGHKYFDGSIAAGNIDDNHGIIWDSRDGLDNEIDWMKRHGVRVTSLTETMLRNIEPHIENKLPTVGLLTMAFNPVYTKSAIFCAAIQNYPHNLMTQYLITQNGDQPPISTDLDFKIVQRDVEGVWPELWLLKLMAFFEVCQDDYIAIFDEDDYFEPDYLSKAVKALKYGCYPMVWNFNNIIVDRMNVVNARYRSAFGTMLIEHDVALDVARNLWRKLYGQEWKPGIKPDFEYGQVRGAQDATYCLDLIARLEKVNTIIGEFESGEKIGLHEGRRWYSYHLNANTCSGRKDEDCVDYWMPRLWYSGTQFEQTRKNKMNMEKI